MSDMQFSTLKTYLKSSVPNILVLFGKDEYLKRNAVDLIKKQLNFQMPDLNVCKIEDFDVARIVFECNTMPFIDEKRLVVGFLPEKMTVSAINDLKKYSENVNTASVLVLVAGAEKPKFDFGLFVDCNTLDERTLSNWVAVTAKKQNVVFEPEAISVLLERTNMQMMRIKSETEKLISLALDDCRVTRKLVDDNVAAEYEYQVFLFADEVAKGHKAKAIEMMNSMMLYEKNIFSVWSVLYGHFRRMFYAKISKEGSKQLAEELGVKEFAITKAKQQAEAFKAVQLKNILDIIGETEANIKTGKMAPDIAIKTGLVSILNTRG